MGEKADRTSSRNTVVQSHCGETVTPATRPSMRDRGEEGKKTMATIREGSTATAEALFQATARLVVATRGRSLLDVGGDLADWLATIGAGDGLLTIFLRHTSASLTVQENASPEVLPDLVDALDRLAPRGRHWRHALEGDDDMPAHVKTALTDVSLSVPVRAGRMELGTWQTVYVVEHRDRGSTREAALHYLGTRAITPGGA